jgi:hypothetical protein
MQNLKIIFFLSLITVYAFQCENEEPFPAFFTTNNWKVNHVDNSGENPKIIANDSKAPLSAYGIHIEAKVSYEDSLAVLNNTATLKDNQCRNELMSIKIFTELPFLDSLEVGDDVTDFFKIRLKRTVPNGSIIDYESANAATYGLNYPDIIENNKLTADFLLTDPPKSISDVQFTVKLTFVDTTYLLPLSKIRLE